MTDRTHSPEVTARVAQARALFDSVPAEEMVQSIGRLFDLIPDEAPDEFIFPALPSTSRARIFGGQVVAQSLMAAARTVEPDKQIHSLHAYFLRGGQETAPLHFRVHRDFDGRSFSNRRVVVRQEGKVIFNLTASFQQPDPGLAHQVPMPDLLPPEECWDFTDFIAVSPKMDDRLLHQMARPRPFEMRSFRPPPKAKATQHYQWFRLRASIGDDPLLNRAFLAFASDMGLLSSSMLPHGLNWTTPGLFSTSLDHAMWFHNDVRVDDWFVFVMDSGWTGNSRGINHGYIYTRDGTLIASVVQEGLLRYKPPA